MRRLLSLTIALVGCSSEPSSPADAGAPLDAAFDQASAPDASDAAAPPDAGVDAPPADPCAGRIVCDDFEKWTAGQAPGAPWKTQLAKGTAVVDETKSFSGKRSIKVSVDATTANDTYRSAYVAVTGAPLIPLANDTVYGRFMITTDRIPQSSVHWTIASGAGKYSGTDAVYNYGGMGNLMANYYRATSPNPTDCWQTKAQNFPTQKWTCVSFLLDGKNSEMRFWLDGVEVPELHVVGMSKTDQTCTVKGVDGRWLAPTFSSVRVGWESYQHDPAGAHTAWIDDVVLDDQPIPCP
jgi:hypothetical protein